MVMHGKPLHANMHAYVHSLVAIGAHPGDRTLEQLCERSHHSFYTKSDNDKWTYRAPHNDKYGMHRSVQYSLLPLPPQRCHYSLVNIVSLGHFSSVNNVPPQ